MSQKTKRISELWVPVSAFLICFVIFSLALIGLVISFKAPFIQSIEYSLEWLPEKYPRNIGRFEADSQRIRYTISHGQAKEHWDFPLKPIEGLAEYKAKSWRLSDKDSLTVNFQKTVLLPVVSFVLMIIFGLVWYWAYKNVHSEVKKNS